MTTKISILVGSLRRESFARKIAENTLEMFPSDWDVKIVEIGHLPIYNNDYDNSEVTDVTLPESYTQFREEMRSSDGILFVTPENNRTMTALMKNAVDIGSTPWSDPAWTNRPAGIISHSPGGRGGRTAYEHLRNSLDIFDMKLAKEPEVSISESNKIFD